MILEGISAAPGFVVGKAFILQDQMGPIRQQAQHSPPQEEQRLQQALHQGVQEIEQLQQQAEKSQRDEEAHIFEAHAMMLQDPELLQKVQDLIQQKGYSAEWCWQEVTREWQQRFAAMDNAYFRERASDIGDISRRILRILTGNHSTDLSQLPEDVILVAKDLTPSETAALNQNKVKAFLLDHGGTTSHTAIMARARQIPAIVGLQNATSTIESGMELIADATAGRVFVSPTLALKKEYAQKILAEEGRKRRLLSLKGKKSITIDHHEVVLMSNIAGPVDIDLVIQNDGAGVGLYRTEFLYMNRPQWPTENEQFEAYKTVLERMPSLPVTIRTLDIGGDKHLDYLDIGPELNPFMGLRAIRLCLDRPDIFRTQLRALLRASSYGQLRIMFPMISSLEEWLAAKAMLDDCHKELEKQGVKIGPYQVGVMIEVPSAVMISDILARHVDFFSIGTNDLIQYSCAVDRLNEKVAHLYGPYHPAVLRLIHHTIAAAQTCKIPVGMCGSMARYEHIIPVLLGMGLHHFSMSSGYLLRTKEIIRALDFQHCRQIAGQVLQMSQSAEIKTYLGKVAEQVLPQEKKAEVQT